MADLWDAVDFVALADQQDAKAGVS